MDFSESELTTACALLFGASWVAAGGRPGDVGAEELKLAFRRRAFAAHPDRAGRLGRAEEDLAAEFRAVGAAHALIVSYRDARQRGEATLVGARDAPREAVDESASPTRLYRGAVPERPLPFGEFLYYCAWISRDELRDALAWQRETRPKFGEIALELRVLRRRQLEAILEEPSGREPVGEAAVASGLMERSERDRVLRVQRQLQSPVGRYFVQAGLMSSAEVRRLLRRQRDHNRRAEAA